MRPEDLHARSVRPGIMGSRACRGRNVKLYCRRKNRRGQDEPVVCKSSGEKRAIQQGVIEPSRRGAPIRNRLRRQVRDRCSRHR